MGRTPEYVNFAVICNPAIDALLEDQAPSHVLQRYNDTELIPSGLNALLAFAKLHSEAVIIAGCSCRFAHPSKLDPSTLAIFASARASNRTDT